MPHLNGATDGALHGFLRRLMVIRALNRFRHGSDVSVFIKLVEPILRHGYFPLCETMELGSARINTVCKIAQLAD